MKVARDYTFSEGEVTDWCRQAQDHNPLHLSERAAEEHPIFEERIVPGMMLLDRVSGLVTQWGEAKEGDPILLGIDAVQFAEPVHFDEEVTITLEETGMAEGQHLLRFDVGDTHAFGRVRVSLP